MSTPREIALSAYDASAREILVEALGMLPDNDPIWLELFLLTLSQNDIQNTRMLYLYSIKKEKRIFKHD